MGLSKIILNIALAIVDLCTFWVHQDPKRITFVSLTQDHLSSDFALIDQKLKGKEYHVFYNLIRFEKNIKGDFLYFLNCLKQWVDLKRSRLVIINDNNYVISHKKPVNTKVLQIWHAAGAIKKFGNDIHRRYPIRNYDAVICSAPAWKPVYARAFGVKEQQVYVTGLPRIDTLMTADTEAFYRKYPQARGKKICLYAPTFRGNIIDGFQRISFDIKKVEQMLPDWLILYKFHPLLDDLQIPDCQAINANKEDLYVLMQVSDCMVSDFSSILLDYSLLGKPQIGYIPDYGAYEQEIGVNISKEEYPGPICTNEAQLVQAIQNLDTYDYEKEKDFQETYIIHNDGKNTDRVVELIDEMMKG